MRAMKYIVPALILMLSITGCKWLKPDKPEDDGTWSKVMILYSAGFNNLSSALLEDIEDLAGGFLPGEKDGKAVIVVSHHVRDGYSYSHATNPHIIRLYKDKKSNVVRDTLMTLPNTDLLTMPAVMESALSYIRDNFKSEHYGLILSSHGTGWLPSGYYSSPESSTTEWTSRRNAPPMPLPTGAVPYVEEILPGPAVKSFGQEILQSTTSTSSRVSYEMEIPELAASIPMHLDYILMDVCLMGGIEVAYELKDVCDCIGFSPAEVLSEGFDYKNITLRLIVPSKADPVTVCSDYYNYYAAQSGSYQSATISCIDCTKLDALAAVCKDLFASYSEKLKAVDPSEVQGYFRYNKHWFYDMEEILVHAGISDADKARLEAALASCVLYNECTARFISFDIATHCGLSMYLPCNGTAYLDTFYKSLAWNRATGLVQ